MILLRNQSRPRRAKSRIPRGRRVYAIGDVHGRLDLLDTLLRKIAEDDSARGPARTTIVLLGDLVDRGPDSRGVIERAMQLHREWLDVRWLIGNHEEVMLRALTGNAALLSYFFRIGGKATLESYGMDDAEIRSASYEELAQSFPGLVPRDHVDFLATGEDMIEIGDYLFVHAGIRPGIPLTDQSIKDLRWIRAEFLDDPREHGPIVIHGHSITETVDIQSNRIGIDTGAFASDVLTAIGLEGSSRWFLSTE